MIIIVIIEQEHRECAFRELILVKTDDLIVRAIKNNLNVFSKEKKIWIM